MKHFVSLFSSLILFILFPICLLAQEKEVTLEEVVVTATRDIQEIRKIPANVTAISKEEIAESNAQTVIDVLRDEVGVVVRDLSEPGSLLQWISEDLEKRPLSTLLCWWMEEGSMRLISAVWTGLRFPLIRLNGLRSSGVLAVFSMVTMQWEE